jgi:YD repeat-containing protein
VATAGGPTVSYDYDTGGRLISRVDATGPTTYTYDVVGNLSSMTDVAGTVATTTTPSTWSTSNGGCAANAVLSPQVTT